MIKEIGRRCSNRANGRRGGHISREKNSRTDNEQSE